MELRNKLALFLLLSVCSVSCFPSRPLNDRPSELTWQAWLLVDSQNQLQNESDRRITPKSVFIAPKLGQRNDSLPDCADGYRADSMGRCIKFVKVDEAAHLNFLLSRLNEMYAANSDEEIEESDESMPTAGPLQVNIPLGESDEYDSEESVLGQTDILAPINGQFDDKLNVKRHPDTKPIEKVQPDEKQDEMSPQTDEDYDDNTEEMLTTTEDPVELTTEYDTTEVSTTEETTVTTETPITTTENAPNDELKALFFLTPTKNNTEQNNATNTSQESTTTQYPIIITLKEDIQADSQHFIENITPLTQNLPLIQQDAPFIHKEDLPFIHREHQHHGVRSPPMRFPEEAPKFPEEHIVRFPPETNVDVKEEYPANVKPHYGPVLHHRPHGGELTPEQIQEIFKQYVHRHASYAERPQLPPDRIYNHRNRDRNEDLWSLTPTVKEDKPLLMRFGRYPSPYYPSQDYPLRKRQTSHHEIQFFDDDTGQDYSNTYGRKRRRGNLR